MLKYLHRSPQSMESAMRILVVEDHRDIAENIGDYLGPKGNEID